MKYILIALAILWAFASLFVGWQWSQNGRYQFRAGDTAHFIDTRTGIIYLPDTATVPVSSNYYSDGQVHTSTTRVRRWGTPPLIVSQAAR